MADKIQFFPRLISLNYNKVIIHLTYDLVIADDIIIIIEGVIIINDIVIIDGLMTMIDDIIIIIDDIIIMYNLTISLNFTKYFPGSMEAVLR